MRHFIEAYNGREKLTGGQDGQWIMPNKVGNPRNNAVWLALKTGQLLNGDVASERATHWRLTNERGTVLSVIENPFNHPTTKGKKHG